MAKVAELHGVSKSYGSKSVVKDLSFSVGQGELVCLLGPNGAGKSTTLNLMLGRKSPDSGQVKLFGQDPRSFSARLRYGLTPQDTDFPKNLRCFEILNLVRGHFANPRTVVDLAGAFGLEGFLSQQTGGLSGGQKRRLALALAFAGRPEAVFLDEPTTGLDVEARRSVLDEVKRYLAQGGTVFLTTHYLPEAEELATRVLVIHQGRLTFEGTVHDLKKKVEVKNVSFRSDDKFVTKLSLRSESREGLQRLWTLDSDALVRELIESNHRFQDLEVLPVSLEDAFFTLMGRAQ